MDFAIDRLVEKKGFGICSYRKDYGNVGYLEIEVYLKRWVIFVSIKRKNNYGRKTSDGRNAVQTDHGSV
jgi:hypothetical protein